MDQALRRLLSQRNKPTRRERSSQQVHTPLNKASHSFNPASGITNSPITPPPSVTSPLLALLLALPRPCVPLAHPLPSAGKLARRPPGFQRRVLLDWEKAERVEAVEEVGKEDWRGSEWRGEEGEEGAE